MVPDLRPSSTTRPMVRSARSPDSHRTCVRGRSPCTGRTISEESVTYNERFVSAAKTAAIKYAMPTMRLPQYGPAKPGSP